eukprot:CAMPEP_0171800750 /NCGR_PEP_ID=MMETSP0991-20121206/71868_1 /TAXON_ID=483369 /ORGANISM="non described non described, Strain CCMP2098" /LENGTH=114 /DNA_ID=CAMNT_0012412325 /DNA_START=427 /DNA_END=769 /DNA_ORIENTATION=-
MVTVRLRCATITELLDGASRKEEVDKEKDEGTPLAGSASGAFAPQLLIGAAVVAVGAHDAALRDHGQRPLKSLHSATTFLKEGINLLDAVAAGMNSKDTKEANNNALLGLSDTR